jgi:hypothetical protein
MKNFCATLAILVSAVVYVVAESIEGAIETLFD